MDILLAGVILPAARGEGNHQPGTAQETDETQTKA